MGIKERERREKEKVILPRGGGRDQGGNRNRECADWVNFLPPSLYGVLKGIMSVGYSSRFQGQRAGTELILFYLMRNDRDIHTQRTTSPSEAHEYSK
jgi:hypothetical protein